MAEKWSKKWQNEWKKWINIIFWGSVFIVSAFICICPSLLFKYRDNDSQLEQEKCLNIYRKKKKTKIKDQNFKNYKNLPQHCKKQQKNDKTENNEKKTSTDIYFYLYIFFFLLNPILTIWIHRDALMPRFLTPMQVPQCEHSPVQIRVKSIFFF